MRRTVLLTTLAMLASLMLVLVACGVAGTSPTPPKPTSPVAGSTPPTFTAPTPTPVATQTPSPTALPSWLTDMIQGLESQEVTNPPSSIVRYDYEGRVVYYQPPVCCDVFGTVYDADGNILGHPDGGITGQGDFRLPDFFDKAQNPRLLWEDPRGDAPDTIRVDAPIDELDLIILESFPVQYRLRVVSGLRNSCESFGGFDVTLDGTTVLVDLYNFRIGDTSIACAEIYGMVETNVDLGSDFDAGVTYTVQVGSRSLKFRDGATGPFETGKGDLDDGYKLVLAPIESLSLNTSGDEYNLAVTYGLPSGCHTFEGYSVDGEDAMLTVQIHNRVPTGDVMCTQVYGTGEVIVPLGSGFDNDVTYTLDINGQRLSFVGGIGPLTLQGER